jgi:beta-galactosidase
MNIKHSSALFSFILLILSITTNAQIRESFSINSNWQFSKGTTQNNTQDSWETVSIPHSWNKFDVMDDEPGYYRGLGIYKKTIYIPANWKNKTVYIHFEGSAQLTTVFLNGKLVGKHTGSYNAFNFNISPFLNFNEDGANTVQELVIQVDNSYHPDIPPLTADFTFFGGLYRDVYLKAVDNVHFDMDNHASSGIFLTTPQVSATEASLNIKGAFINRTNTTKSLIISHKLVNAQGDIIKEIKQTLQAKAQEKISLNQNMVGLKNPKLWSPESPYLYRVISSIIDYKTKRILDEISNPLGFRWFSFDAKNGFFLNGKPLKLMGASRHQDFKDMAHALTDEMHVRDVILLKEMGGNFLRIAHYPQDPAILEACDRLGILASVETPIVNQITVSDAFADNAKNMHLEMIRQHYNHPSLIIWAYMNEVLLRLPPYEKNSAEQIAYFNKITKLAEELENITRREDAFRYTMIPNHGNFDLYQQVKLTKIPMLVGWNLYQGWYSGKLDGFADFLDKHHRELPDKPLLITEYGADADPRLHSLNPVRFDKSMEYTNLYHQAYLKAMIDRPFVAAGMIWNLADFNSETRTESMPHINNKGIMTWDRIPKDGYRFYQANLLKKPYLQIGSKEWNFRTGFAISNSNLTSIQTVLVFSNQPSIILRHNGKFIAEAKTVLGIATFEVPFVAGENILLASAKTNADEEITDQLMVDFKLMSQELSSPVIPFENINISLGDYRYFNDNLSRQIWIPEQVYKPGSWGYIGGKVFSLENSQRQSYGTDKNILNTDLDPIYATQRIGIEQFKFDVPAGDYELVLHFAELLSDEKKEDLIYNLSSQNQQDKFIERVFTIVVNDKQTLQLSNKEFLKPETAFSTKLKVSTKANEGITISFQAYKAEPILNAIQLKRIR